MIDEYITFAEKGYRSTDLSKWSKRPIWVVCEGENCDREGGRGRWVRKDGYRDLCRLCAARTEECYRKRSDSQKGIIPNEEARLKMSIAAKNLSEEVFQKRSETQKRKTGENSTNWKGGISFGKYCPSFNNVIKQYIRDKYNSCDYISGLKDYICNPYRKLDVHHVDYNKQQGCDSEWILIPLSQKNHMRTNANRPFWNRLFTYSLQHDKEYYIEEDKNFDVFSYINEYNSNIIIGIIK